ncbi:HAMP domain-containing protein [Paenibacillus sp. LMG 31461]|uniref:HAMP domain-containing protein n=1 Tax=Paenibacillus plantarum TaxID=2654975 RepID=A0ABX1XF18_9BACL|nr:histidine kinase [Paenibacillus plantarum]NOU67095.1 HAMP domain-containing protein [Paenibacillus plantarum]
MSNSLRKKIIIWFILTTAPLVIFLFYSNYYSMTVLHNQISNSKSSVLYTFVLQADRAMKEASNYIYKYLDKEQDIYLLKDYAKDSDEYVLNKVSITNKLTKDIGFYNTIDAFFVYSQKNQDLIFAVQDTSMEITRVINQELPRFVQNISPQQLKSWQVVQTTAGFAIVKMVSVNEDIYMGSWINVGTMMAPLQDNNGNVDERYYIVSDEGQILSNDEWLISKSETLPKMMAELADKSYQIIKDKQNKQNYLVIGSKSEWVPISFVSVIAEKSLLQNLPFFQTALYFIPIGSLLILSVYLLFLRRAFFVPMANLMNGMRKIAQGDLEIRLKESRVDEFASLIGSFNDMISQIKYLKIHVYEEKLRAQTAEMKHLQMQINPHFYLNTLNIIYYLAALKDYKTVQKMTMHLAEYFRFIMRNNRNFISLEEEVKHIRNYLEIQQLRFPDVLETSIQIPDVYRSFEIPALIIQPFVENAIIHGFQKRGEKFRIHITAAPDPIDPELYFDIHIQDNGVGFADEMLTYLLSSEANMDVGDENHIGIWNVCRRLKIVYNGQARIKLCNGSDGGATVQMRFPLIKESRNKGEDERV